MSDTVISALAMVPYGGWYQKLIVDPVVGDLLGKLPFLAQNDSCMTRSWVTDGSGCTYYQVRLVITLTGLIYAWLSPTQSLLNHAWFDSTGMITKGALHKKIIYCLLFSSENRAWMKKIRKFCYWANLSKNEAIYLFLLRTVTKV